MTTRQSLMLQLLRVLPKNAVSRLVGRLMSVRWPFGLGASFARAYGRIVGVDFDEVRDPLKSFDSVQSFFTRALREGARPLDPDQQALLSPCDGAWGQSGKIDSGVLLQVKGRPYSLAALLGSSERAKTFEGGFFATLYLSPRDYHRFHAPCDAEVERVDYIPGSLWPVNHIGVDGIDGLFAQNERLCIHLAPLMTGGLPRMQPRSICMVAVGATIVGKTRLTFSKLETNVWGAGASSCVYEHDEVRVRRGDEVGRFEFGSTVILLVPRDGARLDLAENGTPLRMGERIGGFDAAQSA